MGELERTDDSLDEMAGDEEREGDSQAIFHAALSGDVEKAKENLAYVNSKASGGYTPLALAASANHLDVVNLLLRHRADPNAQDDEGNTALMHAAMHGFASVIDVLLLHGASPIATRADGEHAVSLAASFGRPASLGTLFRADPKLVDARNVRGWTPLHGAAALGHLVTIKYLIGRWSASVTATDANGRTPLHLVHNAPADALTLLFHGSATQPSLTVKSREGGTPADEVEAAAPDSQVAKALREATTYFEVKEARAANKSDEPLPPVPTLIKHAANVQLLSFLVDAPARSAPAHSPPPPWWQEVDAAGVAALIAVFALAFALCLDPRAGAAAVLALAAVAGTVSYAARSGVDAARRLAAFSRRPHRSRPVNPFVAMGLASVIVALYFMNVFLVAPHLARRGAPILVAATLTLPALMTAFYVRALTVGASMLPGAASDDNAAYWDEIERRHPDEGFPPDFCVRSELRMRPRARFSPMTGGMVQAMDHDCIWIGSVVAQDNHAAFIGFLLSALVTMAAHIFALCVFIRHPLAMLRSAVSLERDDARARLHVVQFTLLVLLFLAVLPLAIFQAYLACFNITTMESMRYTSRNRRPPPWCCARGPMCSYAWEGYALYDKGVRANLTALVLGTRADDAVAVAARGIIEPSERQADLCCKGGGCNANKSRDHDDSVQAEKCCDKGNGGQVSKCCDHVGGSQADEHPLNVVVVD